MIILIILIILVLLSFNLFKKLFKNDVTILDDVKLKEEDPSNNGFALMIEQDDGTYVESNSSTWPTNMKFNSELSGCIDVNGNTIEDALEYDSTNNIMNVSVGETAYCYVYFDIATIEDLCIGKNLGNCLIENNNKIDSLNDNIQGELYRYQGTSEIVTDNYICFGTSDNDECVNDTDKYMYRIIGIASNGQMKVIKKTSLGSKAWHSDKTSNTPWPDSDLFAYLNGNDYLLNTTYVPVGWESKIATTTWKYGDISDPDELKVNLWYKYENGWIDTKSAKIGLMYTHDYLYAFNELGFAVLYSDKKTVWIHIFNNDSSTYEWIMPRYGYYSIAMSYHAYCVHSNGSLCTSYVDTTYAVRPVFFLVSDVEYLMGTGTSEDPFIIKE